MRRRIDPGGLHMRVKERESTGATQSQIRSLQHLLGAHINGFQSWKRGMESWKALGVN